MLGRGYYLALAREHAKRLFGMKEDAELAAFMDELKTAPEMKKSDRVLDIGSVWDPLHRIMTDGELDPSGGDFPESHIVLGGRQLHHGSDFSSILIRPDMVGFVSEALNGLKQIEVRAKFDALPASYTKPRGDKEFAELWLAVQKMRVFFDAAAENLEAVVFTVKYA
ncbi:hypothetical protein ETAA8_14480 [Anatilimnocola aggregata]|uniref:DUF1877 family protein n=1 Tax=Anatilimnocola aggregata TaxID=2528021 RepID=A0A517Y802_9BACT|nr:DUF1877 family protein [Anatilimnocola aggregata]QDU26370.1 hypothetical protein ETAA8_14480 [Anatilimnocola aggregata]